MRLSFANPSSRLRTFLCCVALLFALLCVYTLSLTLIECIPNAQIEYHVHEGRAQLWNDGSKPNAYGDAPGAQLDSATDILMLERAVRDESQSAFYAAMDQQDYARYWHGYLLYLRPLLKFFSYSDIRILHYYVIFLLAFACAGQIRRRLGILPALGFILSLLSGFISVVPLSLQYTSVFVVMLVACLLLLRFSRVNDFSRLLPFFLAVGSLVNFFDYLTVPLLTLGYPLLLLLLLQAQKKDVPLTSLLKTLVLCSLAWGMGYALTWAAKWLIGSLALSRNVLQEALSSILHRTVATGDAVEYPLQRAEMLLLNLKNFLPRGTRVMLSLGLVAALVKTVRHYAGHGRLRLVFAFALVFLFPYAWYMALANHAQVHAWFTYRLQMMSLFALFCGISVLHTDSITASLPKSEA